MAHALQHVAWEPCLIEPRSDRALEAYARRKLGVPQPSIRYFVDCPWLARALVDLHPEFGLLVHLDLHLADLISLVVSQENSCRFCYAAVRAMLRIQGMSEARIQRIEADLTRADLGSRPAAAMVFARTQSRSGPAAAAAAKQALRAAGVGAEELKEIAFVVASVDFMNRASTIPAVPSHPMERLPDRFHVWLLRPLINRIMNGHRSRGRATPTERAPSYPYSGLVKAFAGSPIASALGRTLEEMWASSLLTRRCKLFAAHRGNRRGVPGQWALPDGRGCGGSRMMQMVVVGAVQALTRIHQVDILVTDALRTELDARFVLAPMPAELVKGIAEPVVTYAVREMQREVGTHARTTPGGALMYSRGAPGPGSLPREERA